MSTIENQKLSPKALENLKRNEELRQKDSKYIKIEAGKEKILHFNAEKIEQREGEFKGKKNVRILYTVTQPEEDSNQEKLFAVPKGASAAIDKFLMEGKNLLRIQKFGEGESTRYFVTAVA